MDYSTLKPVSLGDRPELIEPAQQVCGAAWPEFMLQDPMVNKYWRHLYLDFPQFQFVLLAPGTESIVAVGNSVPLAWADDLASLPAEGVDWALPASVEHHAAGRRANLLCALQIVVVDEARGCGVSSRAVQAMMAVGRQHNCNTLIAPVRPNLKSRYPLTPMERYINWQRPDDLPFDAWLRVHARLGARTIGVCSRSMQISGRISEWEQWTGMIFPESGPYIVPGALAPVEIDCAADRGLYVEPNVWMVHGQAPPV